MTDQTPPPAPEAPTPPVSGWAAPAATAVPGAAGFVYADVPNRVIALIIDAVILGVLYVIVGIILAGIGLASGGLATGNGSFNFVGTLVLGVVLAIVNAAYFIWSWTTMRATIGMRALGMQVGNAFDGKTVTMDQALRRGVALWGPQWAAQFLSGAPVIGSIVGLLAFLWVLYLLYTTATSPTKQGWHDKFANTVVVKAGRVV
ncbi:MAG TPA: RDD family protein [Candidatus Limnocylindrales bacterium]|jgi:uncharacterized RDD family membrane protein YckC